jgi:hypothetical protein
MRRFLFAAVVLLSSLAYLGAGPARAQYPYERPPLSPYLNLARPGNPAFNYYGLVRPAEDYNRTVNQLQTGITTNQENLERLATVRSAGSANLPPTGHSIGYMTGYQRYFLNMSPGATGAYQTAPFAGATSGAVPGQTTFPQTSPIGSLSPLGLPVFGTQRPGVRR